ncbi:MAG: TonB-dependent receptor [Caulobacterales bacterium]|nr:TonB-dependent receptor [Caulobacterales bacterium]
MHSQVKVRVMGIKVKLAAGVGGAALWAACAGAQDAGSGPDEKHDIITVYGTSNPLPAFDYPGQVSVIVREEMELFAPSAVSDALRDVPGLDFVGGPRRTGETPTLRGLARENVLILLDGAPQSFTSAHDGEFFLDPELVRSAEVVKGAASALYGSGAIGGVLAFETVDAADLLRDGESAGARVRIGYQGANEEALATLTGFARQGRLDGLFSVGVRDSGDIRLGSGVDLPSDDDIVTALVKGAAAVTDALLVDASWQRFDNSAVEPNNGQGVLGTGDSVLDRTVEKDVETDTYRARAVFAPEANTLIDVALTLYRADTAVEELDPTLPRTTVRDITTTGVTARNAARFDLFGAETVVTLGGDWRRDEQEGSDDNSVDGTRQGVPSGESRFAGLFAQLETRVERPFGLPGELLVIPGVRFDRFESSVDGEDEENDDSEISPRLGASYGPNEWLRVFGSYSQGFRAPSINELFLTGVHFPLPHPVLFDPAGFPPSLEFVNNNFVPNPDLLPEKAETFEAGAGVDFTGVITAGDRLTGKVSYYDTEVEDLINLFVDVSFPPSCFVPPFFPCDAGITTSENLDMAKLSGVELEGVYDSRRLRVSASFSHIEGENAATGEDISTLTPDRLNLDARVKLPAWNAAIGARLQLAGELERRALDDADELVVAERRASYAVLDLYGSWSPAFAEGLRVDLGVDNVFDTDYERVFEDVGEPGVNPRIAISYRVGF